LIGEKIKTYIYFVIGFKRMNYNYVNVVVVGIFWSSPHSICLTHTGKVFKVIKKFELVM